MKEKKKKKEEAEERAWTGNEQCLSKTLFLLIFVLSMNSVLKLYLKP